MCKGKKKCGPCEAAARRRRAAKISGFPMAKNIVNTKVIASGARAAAGFAVANILTNMVPVPPNISFAVPLVGAGLTAGIMGKKGAEVAVGMAVSGVVKAVQQFAPQIASQVGLAGYLPAGSGQPLNRMAGYRMHGTPESVPNGMNITVQ